MKVDERYDEFCRDPFSRSYRTVFFFCLLALCSFIRLWRLDYKSMMHDELLFAVYTYRNLYKAWDYFYEPILHGPLMLHLQNLVFHIFGVSDYTVRLGVAILGIASFFWIWKLRYWLREAGTWTALLFYSLSPGIGFFQRFFHQDALYLFCTLWIVASLANWWRTRSAAWLVSAIVAITALFTNKASAIFLYFTLGTFLALLVIHDLSAYLLEGKDSRLADFLKPAKRFRVGFWLAIATAGFAILVLTQVFEGLRYEASVITALGHDFPLKDVSSIPILLGWVTPAAGAPALETRKTWAILYGGIIVASLALAALLSVAINRRIGHREFLTSAWDRLYTARWYAIGALGLSLFFYLAIYTTFFRSRIGLFQIYNMTWAYWGGQHEIGRIAGPFHQHMLNMVIYETPAVLVIAAAWVCGLFRLRWTRTTGVAFLLMAVAAGGFHKLLFSGIEFLDDKTTLPAPAHLDYFRMLFFGGVIAGIVTILVPRVGRAVLPIAFVLLVVYSFGFFGSSEWARVSALPVYKHGEAVNVMTRHVKLSELMEIEFNFDYGWNVALVAILIFFATIYTWDAIDKGRRFQAFTVWWLVTMIGVASYSREAVPQTGIHAMLAAIILAALYVDRLAASMNRRIYINLAVGFAGVCALWSAKATFNMNFRQADDPRERMAYGPSNRDVKNHMQFIRDYAAIASLKKEDDKYVYLSRYNDIANQKDVKVYIKTMDYVTWPAKWYLRDVAYEEGSDVARAVKDHYDFIFMAVEDVAKFPELETEYNIAEGRGTTFWTPNAISPASLANIWKEQIPGHYLDASPQAAQAWQSKQDWHTIWNYLVRRQTFEGTDRPVPSVSAFPYVFCYRKELF